MRIAVFILSSARVAVARRAISSPITTPLEDVAASDVLASANASVSSLISRSPEFRCDVDTLPAIPLSDPGYVSYTSDTTHVTPVV